MTPVVRCVPCGRLYFARPDAEERRAAELAGLPEMVRVCATCVPARDARTPAKQQADHRRGQ